MVILALIKSRDQVKPLSPNPWMPELAGWEHADCHSFADKGCHYWSNALI